MADGSMAGYLGVDLGGTKTALALMDETGTVVAQDVFPTQADAGLDAWLERTAAAGRKLGSVWAVGVGAAGQVDGTGMLVATANVGGWHQVNLGARLGELLGCPGTTDNDAKVELLAEMHEGAAKGAKDVFLIAVGTGVGGALAVGGRIYRGARGFAGEVGHTVVEGGDRLCGCGRCGHLETLTSGTGIAKSAHERVAQDGAAAAGLAAALEGESGARAVFAAAQAGDTTARAVLDSAADTLGNAIASVVTLFDPEVVVLAGGVAEAGEGFWQRARKTFEEKVHRTLVGTPWRPAILGEKAGAIGACLVARSVVETARR
jgi:glucokinase